MQVKMVLFLLSLMDLGMGLGFTVSLTILGAFRELLGAGTIFGKTILSESFYTPITIFILAPGAFFVLACLVAARNKIMNRKVKNGRDGRDSCRMWRLLCLR